jgi:hypothetical protein
LKFKDILHQKLHSDPITYLSKWADPAAYLVADTVVATDTCLAVRIAVVADTCLVVA